MGFEARVDADGMLIRFCIRCNAPIVKCMGFVLVRDTLPHVDGTPIQNVREQCGLCVLRPDSQQFLRMLI